MSIIFCTTVKNRTEHLRQTLPKNLRDNPKSKFLVLNYNTEDDLLDYLFSEHEAEIRSGRLIVYSELTEPKFHVANAKNIAARCAILEGADILITLDADNFTETGFEDYIDNYFKLNQKRLIFLCPTVVRWSSIGAYHTQEELPVDSQ